MPLDPGPDPSEMIIHLEREAQDQSVLTEGTRKTESFKRRDKLKTHLQRVHNLSETSTQWGKWHQRATTRTKQLGVVAFVASVYLHGKVSGPQLTTLR